MLNTVAGYLLNNKTTSLGRGFILNRYLYSKIHRINEVKLNINFTVIFLFTPLAKSIINC